MANCPNCGKRLTLLDWKQTCPQCGINLVYFQSNERLLEESEKAEIEHAKHQPGIDRAKASIFGSAPAVVRLVLSVLPLAALFLPLCVLSLTDGVKKINAIGIYNYISEKGFGNILSSAFSPNPADAAVLLLLFSAVMILVCGICLVMSLGRHGTLRNAVLDIIMMTAAAASQVCILIAGRNPGAYFEGCTSVRAGIGALLYMLLLTAVLICNLVLAKKGLKVKHTVCYIGGLPSDEYFRLVEQGMSDLEIRKRMVEALTAMQEEIKAKEAEAAAAEEERRRMMK